MGNVQEDFIWKDFAWENLRKDIDRYLEQYYIEVDEHFINVGYTGTAFSGNILKSPVSKYQTKEKSLEELLDEVGESFHDMLFRKIDDSQMTDVEVYKAANLDRKLFSKIRSNPAYHPRKDTVLALAIALRLDIEETIDFLSRAEYALSPGSKGDLIVKYFIEHQIYDIQAINCALYEYGLPTLGNTQG